MTPNTTTYDDISPRTNGLARRKLLERGQRLMVAERFGYFDPQQKNKTKTAMWRRYNSLARATSPLAEGVPPAGQKLTYTDITATLEQYGDSVDITDVVKDTHEDIVDMEALDLCAEQIAETVEELRINVLKAGTTVYYANGVSARTSVNSPATRGDFRKIKRFFQKYKGRVITRIIKASGKISTEPVAPAYFAMGHTDLDSDLRDLSGFIPVEQYSDSDKSLPGEIGKIEAIRIILTSMFDSWQAGGASGTTYLSGGNAVTSAASCDVYPMIIVAKNAYAIVPLQGEKAVTPYIVNPKPQVSDKLAQIGFVAWKLMTTAAILNENWIARLEVAATANPE